MAPENRGALGEFFGATHKSPTEAATTGAVQSSITKITIQTRFNRKTMLHLHNCLPIWAVLTRWIFSEGAWRWLVQV